jgi:hypothetical protein
MRWPASSGPAKSFRTAGVFALLGKAARRLGATEEKAWTMSNGEPQPTAPNLMREQRLQRNLKIVVGVLGALILLGLAAVIVRIGGLATGLRLSAPGVKTTYLAPTIGLELPAGAKIVSVSLSGNRLAVHHEGPEGVGIAIVDIETGRRIFDIKTVQPVPRN